MSGKNRNIKFLICLTSEEKKTAQQMAEENCLTISELFRTKTINNKLPRRITKIASQTYWELGKISNSLNEITKKINISTPINTPVIVDRELLEKLGNLLIQIRRELAEIDLITDIQNEP